MPRLAAAVTLLALTLAPAGIAEAQIGPLPQAPPPPPPELPNQTNPRNQDDGLSTRQMLLIAGAAALLIGAIGYVIVRDARRSAPAPDRAKDADAPKLSARERERVKRQKRDKAKAARRQRKRNRSR